MTTENIQPEKILEEGDTPFMNGSNGAMCGGVMSFSQWQKDPMTNMMAFYMDDEKFEIYKNLRSKQGKEARKKAEEYFKRHAISAI